MDYSPARVMETYLTEVVLHGRLELVDELFHDDVVDEAALAFGGKPGVDGLRAHVIGFRRHVGNLSLEIERLVAAESEVMAQWSFSGTHDGPWLGRTPTGDVVRGTVFSFFDLKEGRVNRYRLWLHARFDESVVFDSTRGFLVP